MEVLDGLGDPLMAAEAAARSLGTYQSARGATDAALELIDERMRAIEGFDGAERGAASACSRRRLGTLIRPASPPYDAAEALLRLHREHRQPPGARSRTATSGWRSTTRFIGPQSLALLLFDAAASDGPRGP